MLSMAKGIKVGSEVRVRGKFSTQKGVVQASEGVGRARKWIVKLNGLFHKRKKTPAAPILPPMKAAPVTREMREVDEDGASRRASDVQKGGERRDMWKTESNGPFPAPALGREFTERAAKMSFEARPDKSAQKQEVKRAAKKNKCIAEEREKAPTWPFAQGSVNCTLEHAESQ
ncbi:hypothetical protein EMCRGX_G011400 [Ephydatia muelleri]